MKNILLLLLVFSVKSFAALESFTYEYDGYGRHTQILVKRNGDDIIAKVQKCRNKVLANVDAFATQTLIEETDIFELMNGEAEVWTKASLHFLRPGSMSTKLTLNYNENFGSDVVEVISPMLIINGEVSNVLWELRTKMSFVCK